MTIGKTPNVKHGLAALQIMKVEASAHFEPPNAGTCF